jgi:hypothetical protein
MHVQTLQAAELAAEQIHEILAVARALGDMQAGQEIVEVVVLEESPVAPRYWQAIDRTRCRYSSGLRFAVRASRRRT